MSRTEWTVEGTDFNNDIPGFTITDAFFATEERYMGGTVYLLHWIGLSSEGRAYEAGSFHPSFACPTGWTSVDGGKTIMDPNTPTPAPKKSSLFGKLIDQVLEITPETPGNDPLDADHWSPFRAADWVGFTFDLAEVPIQFGKTEGKPRLWPVTFHGSPTAAAPAAAAPVSPMEAQLRQLAKQHGTQEQFAQAALMLPRITEPANAALMAQVVDKTAAGFFAQNH